MLVKKIRKLVYDPKLFFSDMVVKYKHRIDNLKPKTHNSHHKFTVVSAVYNVDRYLNDYFKSLTSQRLDFKKNIKLVLVDDGSTDNSAETIKHWQKKFPENITYVWKKNGGQSSARNLGLMYVNTEWMTYIDPDDFVDKCYFNNIVKIIDENDDISLISCNFIFYNEKTKTTSDTHPLRYRFTKNKKVKISEMDNMIQMHVNSVFFKKSIIKDSGLIFNEKIRPNFEDGHFVANYIKNSTNKHIYFCKDAKYFYRKRVDADSTLDTSWSKVGKFTDVLEFGYLDILNKNIDVHGKIPKVIQWTIIYELLWHFKYLLQRPDRSNFLTNEQKNKYLKLLYSIFSLIETKEIINFNLAGAWFYHKLGIIETFKTDTLPFQIVYLDSLVPHERDLKIRYFIKDDRSEQSFYFDNVKIEPSIKKLVKHDFLDINFCYEVIAWIKIPNNSTFFHASISNINTMMSLNGKNIKGALKIKDIYTTLSTKSISKNSIYDDAWLFMDKDTSADDNAEHLYRYTVKNHPDTNAFFVLHRKSKDWKRLKNDGFKLIEYGTSKHKKALESCRKLISSHADYYVTDYLGKDTLKGKEFIFLQHGVTKDDISPWINTKRQINLITTTSTNEYNSFCENNSRYKLTKKEVALTGMARHDALIINGLKYKQKKRQLLIIMPTWRRTLTGNRSKLGSNFDKIIGFRDSLYFKKWNDMLSSKGLSEMIDNLGIDVIFAPHDYMKPYIGDFSIADGITIASKHDTYQDLLSRADFMITDYSSVAFDMAIQGKPTFYYQFDSDTFFNGSHNYIHGYFDYHRDGFGPVSNDEKSIIENVMTYLNNNMKLSDDIQSRIKSFSSLGDGNSCARIYNTIVNI